MTYLRILALALLLSGCDETPDPAPVPVPAEPATPPLSQQQSGQAPAALQDKPQSPRKADSGAATPAAAAAAEKPAAPRAPVGKTPAKAAPPVEQLPPLPPLDMSLPEELLEDAEPGVPLQPEPVLPSLLGREIKRDYRINGRLIESSDGEHMVEGAELRLEIRR